MYRSVDTFDNEKRYDLISELLIPSGSDLIVTPKEVDSIIDEVSGIIADSINEAINGKTAKKLGKII
jgi:spore protease